jgi:hypothetical protein
MPNTIHDPQKWLEKTNKEWDIFGYAYQFSLKDKIYVSTLENKSHLIDSCLKSSVHEKFNNNLAGDIQSEYRVTSDQALEDIREELKIHLSRITNKTISAVDITHKDGLDDAWVNRQKATEFNPSHDHTGIYSFVIYADIPESIRKEHEQSFSQSTQVRGLIQFHSEFTNQKINFNPSTHTIFIFQSSHQHQVYPFYSDETRITIAGNIHGWE